MTTGIRWFGPCARRPLTVVALTLAGVLGACGSDSPAGLPADVEISLVELLPEELELEVGDTIRVQATAYDDRGEPQPGHPVQWVVGHTDVVEVSSTGLVRAKREGNSFVRAIAGNTHGTALLRVSDPSAPQPAIVTLQPSSATTGGAGFTLVVRGSAFGGGSTILWGGDKLGTTRMDDSELRASVSAEAVQDAGTVEIRVTRYGSTSDPATFTIHPASSGAPELAGLHPASVPAGSLPFTLSVSGRHFTPADEVFWNGTARPTTWISAGELRADIRVGDVWFPGPAQIRVVRGDSTPQDGTESTPLVFTVAPSGVETVDVSPATLGLLPGEAADLHVRLLDHRGEEITGRYVSFHSTDATIASADGEGRVEALRSGSTRIRVSTSDHYTHVTVTVDPPPVHQIFVSPGEAIVMVAGQIQMNARAFGQNGEELPGVVLDWWSSEPAIASVDANGVVTAHSKGEARIWVEGEGQRASARVEARQLPATPDWTFDLQWDVTQVLPVMGDTTWVDGVGITHTATYTLVESSVTLHRAQSRWSQRMVWRLWENGAKLGDSVREDAGPYAYDPYTGDYLLVSDDRPGVTAATGRVAAGVGELHLRQAVGTAAAANYRYVIR